MNRKVSPSGGTRVLPPLPLSGNLQQEGAGRRPARVSGFGEDVQLLADTPPGERRIDGRPHPGLIPPRRSAPTDA